LTSALFIFNITFLASQQKKKRVGRGRREGGLFSISRKQNRNGGRAVPKNKTPAGASIPFFEK
jgi:hypothetical protein